MISSILFDLGNVLVRLDYALWQEKMKELFVSPEFIDSEDYKLICNKYMSGKLSTVLFLNAIIKVSKENVQARDVINAWNSLIVELPEARIKLLQTLQSQYDLFLLSNNCELHVEYAERKFIKTHGAPDYNERFFLRTFYSQDMGMIKPDPSIFKEVLNATDINPETCLFVDDFEENTLTAKSLGFHVLHLKEFDQLDEALIASGIIND